MEQMTRREQELQGLYALQKDQELLANLESEQKEIECEQEIAENEIRRAIWDSFRYLNDSNVSRYSSELQRKREKTKKKQVKTIKLLGVAPIAVLGIFGAFLTWMNRGQIVDVPNWASLVAIGVFTIAACCYACVGDSKTFKELIEFVFSGEEGWAFVVMVLFVPPLAGLGIYIYAMLQISNVLIALPVLMVALLIVVQVAVANKERDKSLKLTQSEEKVMAEKKALDEKNSRINEQNHMEAEQKVRRRYKGRLQELETQLSKCKKNITDVEAKIQNNGYLVGKDIQWLEQVIQYIQSRRADSIKEALRLVDLEQEKERQRKLDEQRHKEIMEELEYQSWEAANARAEQREAAERAEKALRESEAAAARARYDAEMRAYEENWKADQHRQNVEWELRKMRDDG